MTKNKTLECLEQHPRMIGFLFTMGMVMMQAGNVAANAASTNGP